MKELNERLTIVQPLEPVKQRLTPAKQSKDTVQQSPKPVKQSTKIRVDWGALWGEFPEMGLEGIDQLAQIAADRYGYPLKNCKDSLRRRFKKLS